MALNLDWNQIPVLWDRGNKREKIHSLSVERPHYDNIRLEGATLS